MLHHNRRHFTSFPLTLLVLLMVYTAFVSPSAHAQEEPINLRYGLGFNTMISTSEGLGFGFRGRVSVPVNQDLSLAGDLGLTGFILGGQDDAVYVLEPQGSAIITLPGSTNQAPYLLVGFGAYIPVSSPDDEDPDSGPVLHAGYGRVYLLQEATFYWEFDPGLIIGESAVGVLLPLRIGVIF